MLGRILFWEIFEERKGNLKQRDKSTQKHSPFGSTTAR
jgi:hypothetical protein